MSNIHGCKTQTTASATLKITEMKKLTIFAAVIAASLIATKSYSQVFVSAHLGFRVPGARVYVASAPVPPPVVYQPAPVYAQTAPVYDGGYYADPSICETDFPGYAYYDYPAWYGHYRDRVYFEHYRPFFERDHRTYFYGGRFDHARFDNDRGYSRGFDRGYARGTDRGYARGTDHGYARGTDRGYSRGYNHERGSHGGRR